MEDVLLVLVGQEVEKKQEFKVQTVKVQTLRRRVVKVFGVPVRS